MTDDRTGDRGDHPGDDGSDPLAERPGDAPGDADLVAQVREGRDEPYAELFRRHRPAALALARTLTEHSGADDVVSEAFEKLLHRIREGGGPDAAFRPYLLRTVRTVAVDASRRTRRLVVAEEPTDAVAAAATDDELVDRVHERTILAQAFGAIPERWQTFLWLSFVEDADRDEIARVLGISVGSVSALGYRAREGLRRAYLDAHLREAPTAECREVWPLLAGAVRGGLGPAQQARVDQHLATCDHCRTAAAELEAVNTRFGSVLAPLVLGAAGPAYLTAVQEGGRVAVAGLAAGPEPVHLLPGLKGTVAGLGKTSAAGAAVVACVATVAVVALLAALTTPLASERAVAPRPGETTLGEGSPDGADTAGTQGPSSTSAGTPGDSSSPGDPSSAAGSDPSASGLLTDDPSATSGGPSGLPTASTGGPTGGPAGVPAGGPPTGPGPSTPTSPSETVPADVDAALGGIAVNARSSAQAPAHVAVPISLAGGRTDLRLTLSIRGLTKFTVTHGAGEADWPCVATTPMAGANKTAILRCTLEDADPGSALGLGINLGYSGDGSVFASIEVLGGAVDTDSSNNTTTVNLPDRQAD